MRTLKLDIVSDVVCPWCVIGYRRLQRAMEAVGEEIRFDIEWHPFELNPDMPPEGENIVEHVMRKYGITREASTENRERIAAFGRELGFEFRMTADRRIYNTFDAHRVLHWARLQGQQDAFNEALFKAYFTDGRDPSDPELLAQIAEQLGLDGAEARAVLASDRYAAEVREEEERYTSAGIHAVPAYIIEGKYLVSGAQEPEAFERAFRQIAAEQETGAAS